MISDRLIFLPPPATYRDAAATVHLTTADGVRISAVHLVNPDAEFTILYSHGNAEDLGLIAPQLVRLRDWGFSILAYDYRGYGTSQGRPSEHGVYEDVDAAYAYLTSAQGVPADRIIAYGRSVGSGPAVDLAARRPLAGLVVESAFVTAFRVMTRVPLLPFDKFRNVDKIARVSCPVLVMHGVEDDIVPLAHGRRLFTAAREPKRFLWVDGVGHNDFTLLAADRQAQALRQFSALLHDIRARRGQ
ncbi:MAG TPA: alpha/beta hydrolase [Candidatus Methylomirabilis sp.]|nr:alpha/beta hydrolase [Candidatus Methylomirabilis sp.]